MDRRTWKAEARQDVALNKKNSTQTTLVYWIWVLSLTALTFCVSLLVRHFGPSGGYLSDTVSAGGRNFLIQLLFSIVCQVVLLLLTAGYTTFILLLIRRKGPTPDTLWSAFRRPGRVIWLNILQNVFLTLWCILFFFVLSIIFLPVLTYFTGDAVTAADIEEGPIWASMIVFMVVLCVLIVIIAYRYYLSLFLLMDYPQLTARQALMLSVAITKGHRWKLFVLDLSFLPWILLCSLTLGILLIWKLPYIEATRARAYRAILEDYGQHRQDFIAGWDNIWPQDPAGGTEPPTTE